ncbi:hypothetical protein BGZ76_002358 [Entomortierella beljakovae]|nr:hypothetical protein BGZ76_002358 [Entomortierella beljakovae]
MTTRTIQCARFLQRWNLQARFPNKTLTSFNIKSLASSSASYSTAFRTTPHILKPKTITTLNIKTSPCASISTGYPRYYSDAATATAPTEANPDGAFTILNPQYDDSGKQLTVDVTDRAIKQLKHIATRDKNPLQALRITVDSGGCHGYQYLMELTDTVNEDDVVFEKDGGRVIVDTITLPMISGSKIDFIEELIGSAFKVVGNPQAAHSCGKTTTTEEQLQNLMTGAIGISRLIILGPCNCKSVATGIVRRTSNVNFTSAHYSNKTLWSSALEGKSVFCTRRTLSTSPVPQKRLTKKTHRDPTVISNEASTKKRRSKTNKNQSVDSLIERTSQILSESSSANISERPTYVTAPSVSAKEMVRAIESSRHEATIKSLSNASTATSTISPGDIAESDPFGKSDPFANQLEAAIKASVKTPYNHRDRFTEAKTDNVRLPDVQAKYLVGPARWETVRANEVEIKNVTPKHRPNVAVLEHGLDRVLFNPGVHWLQDPRSLVYNFDPYLRTICQPDDFDYTALPEYRPSSMDPDLLGMTKTCKKKFMGSTSSMTSALSQFYFLISAWKPLKTSHLSEAFSSQPKGFTRISRSPSTIQLVYKGQGIYAVDADKTFDSSTILMQLGKSMEKMLTSTSQEFSRFTKTNSWQVKQEEREKPEAFNYITADKFLLRSQLDCEDPRLPGKTFDLKTRAAVAIRLDVHNYELNQGYQLRKAHGYLESFEREYYDMMRSAFLKYSLQVRIGQMDGIFVAFHNTARIFGFQYISLDEMDSRLFGSSVMGDECFRNQLRLMNRALEEITTKYPEQDVKITFDTDETVQSMNVWVETLPLGAATSPTGKDVPVTFDENGVPMMQPGADLSLWQIVCYSNINKVPTVGPFELTERATDDWELRYKIAELSKPHMMNEYHRMKAIQAEILSDEQKIQAALAANANDTESGSKNDKREASAPARAVSKRDSMRNTMRRISEAGRSKQEDEDRRHADNDFLVWEPKGYVKIDPSQTLVAVTTNDIIKDALPSTPKPNPTKYQSKIENHVNESISEKMIRRLRAIGPPDTTKDTETGLFKRPSGCYYVRSFDSKPLRLSLEEFALVKKSMSGPLTEATDIEKLKHISIKHGWLLQTLSPYDEIRLKMIEIPQRVSGYRLLNREQLEYLSKVMDQPESARSAEVTDDDLRTKLFESTPQFRNKLHLDYYHKWLHKTVALKEDAKPYSSVDEFIAVSDIPALVRAANGVHVNLQMVKNVSIVQKFEKPDAIKKAILTQIYYAEKAFTDEELKEMGYLPRIFDPTKIQDTRHIMRDIQLKTISKRNSSIKDSSSDNSTDKSTDDSSEFTSAWIH